ncbi:MAG: COX15/CtaA family protein [Bacteroidota bacterium]
MTRLDINTAPIVKRYRFLATLTVGAVIFLILVGALVRMTGSGMGCPDWPTCFGQWIPPTDIDQLPADYKTRFKVAGKEIADFDAYKTWIEYINRLIGVLIGFFALITGIVSLGLRKTFPKATLWSLLGLFMVIVQGGIGAYVVRTNLHTGMITLHMMIALAILSVYLMGWLQVRTPYWKIPSMQTAISPQVIWVGVSVFLLVVVQVFMGTQVREGVDLIAKSGEDRSGWIAQLTGAYDIHKYFYYLVSAGIILWVYQLRKQMHLPMVRILSITLIGTLIGEIALGLGMHHFAIPAWMQPLHLLGATLLFAAAFTLLMVCRFYLASGPQPAPSLTREIESSGVVQ